MTRDEWNDLVARYMAALERRMSAGDDPIMVNVRDKAVADALLAVLDGWQRIDLGEPKTPDELDHPCFFDDPDTLCDCPGDGWYRCRECRVYKPKHGASQRYVAPSDGSGMVRDLGAGGVTMPPGWISDTE